ncbi:hypothetical protein PSN01_04679 [Micromonospora saelicesensis]|nr:hypothetical protein PSN01_04679 [Micromonospora saelicesensis]
MTVIPGNWGPRAFHWVTARAPARRWSVGRCGGGRRPTQLASCGTGRTVRCLRRRHPGGRRADRCRSTRDAPRRVVPVAGGVLDDGRARRGLRRAPVRATGAPADLGGVPVHLLHLRDPARLGSRPGGGGAGGGRRRLGLADAARRVAHGVQRRPVRVRPRRRLRGDPARLGHHLLRWAVALDRRGGRRRCRAGLVRRQLRVGQLGGAAAVRGPLVAHRPPGPRLRVALYRLTAAARPGAGRGGAGQRRADPAGAGAALRRLPDGAVDKRTAAPRRRRPADRAAQPQGPAGRGGRAGAPACRADRPW